MVTQVQFRRGTTAQHASFTGANGEITIDTDKDTVVVHDGATAGGFPLQTTAGLNANIASYLPSYTGVVNATTVSTGSINVVNASGLTTTANVNIGAAGELILTAGAGIYANGGLGSAGEVLHSNGSSVYWSTDDPGVTSVATGNGLTGGTITTTGTLSVLANTGLVANATGLHVNSSVMLTSGNQTISGGFSVTSYNLGTGSGTVTPSAVNGNYQYLTNNGAFTLAAPASDCAIDILVTNGASAGSITLSGFTAPSGGGGDTYATTNANRFLLLVRRINSISTYVWKALQ